MDTVKEMGIIVLGYIVFYMIVDPSVRVNVLDVKKKKIEVEKKLESDDNVSEENK